MATSILRGPAPNRRDGGTESAGATALSLGIYLSARRLSPRKKQDCADSSRQQHYSRASLGHCMNAAIVATLIVIVATLIVIVATLIVIVAAGIR